MEAVGHLPHQLGERADLLACRQSKCGYIVADEGAVLGFPETGIGIYPGLGGTQRMVKRCGLPVARYLLFTGDIVPAAKAAALGLVDRVAPSGGTMGAIKNLLAEGKIEAGVGAGGPAEPSPEAAAVYEAVFSNENTLKLFDGTFEAADKQGEKIAKKLGKLEAEILEREQAVEALGWKLGDPEVYKDEQTMKLLWQDLGGTAREKLADAEAYQARVVETAKANADYLQRLLPEYRLRPKLVLQKIYLDAIKRIFANAEETYVVQSAENAKDGEIRVVINRDPLLKPKKKETPATNADR